MVNVKKKNLREFQIVKHKRKLVDFIKRKQYKYFVNERNGGGVGIVGSIEEEKYSDKRKRMYTRRFTIILRININL